MSGVSKTRTRRRGRGASATATSTTRANTPRRNNNSENTATSAIRASGRRAGFTGQKLAIWTILITATLGAMFAPTLAAGFHNQRLKIASALKNVDNKYAIQNQRRRIEQRKELLKLQETAQQLNALSNSLAEAQLQQSYKREQVTKNEASKAAAANAFRNLTSIPVRAVSTATGVATNVLNILNKTSKNTKRTIGAVTETVAKTTENVQETAGVVTGSMVSTSKFFGPFAFAATMVVVATMGSSIVGISIPANVIKQIRILLTSMIRKGVPMTKSVLVGIFNKLYSYIRTPPAANSGRFENVTN
jgi:hypothetical protein